MNCKTSTNAKAGAPCSSHRASDAIGLWDTSPLREREGFRTHGDRTRRHRRRHRLSGPQALVGRPGLAGIARRILASTSATTLPGSSRRAPGRGALERRYDAHSTLKVWPSPQLKATWGRDTAKRARKCTGPSPPWRAGRAFSSIRSIQEKPLMACYRNFAREKADVWPGPAPWFSSIPAACSAYFRIICNLIFYRNKIMSRFVLLLSFAALAACEPSADSAEPAVAAEPPAAFEAAGAEDAAALGNRKLCPTA